MHKMQANYAFKRTVGEGTVFPGVMSAHGRLTRLYTLRRNN
jgi:hypothetical protein